MLTNATNESTRTRAHACETTGAHGDASVPRGVPAAEPFFGRRSAHPGGGAAQAAGAGERNQLMSTYSRVSTQNTNC